MKVIMNLLLLIVFLFAFDTSSFADSVTLTSTVSTSKSASRFTDNGDNTITDNVTGLTWINNVSQVGTAWYETPMKWVDAIKNCEELSYAGYPDWRLPNIKELQSILNFERSDHSIGEGTSEIQRLVIARQILQDTTN